MEYLFGSAILMPTKLQQFRLLEMTDDNQFINYIDVPGIHDAIITGVRQTENKVTVTLQSYGLESFGIEFHGVQSVASVRSVGMMVYSLSEMRAPTPVRRFVFTYWDEKDDAILEVQAQDFTVSNNS
jgi:hypothetical protein